MATRLVALKSALLPVLHYTAYLSRVRASRRRRGSGGVSPLAVKAARRDRDRRVGLASRLRALVLASPKLPMTLVRSHQQLTALGSSKKRHFIFFTDS
jgi:hypothetical protein